MKKIKLDVKGRNGPKDFLQSGKGIGESRTLTPPGFDEDLTVGENVHQRIPDRILEGQ